MDINETARKWVDNNKEKSLLEAFIAGFVTHGEFAEGVRLKKEEKLEALKKQFYQELIPYVKIYGKEVVREFYDWFCQPNKSGTNINRYMQKTWDTKLRLAQWVSRSDNSKSFTPKNEKKEEPAQRKYKEIS